jgi:transposase
LNQVPSSRRLEAECHRNMEVIWMMRELKPERRTIADYLSDRCFSQIILFADAI